MPWIINFLFSIPEILLAEGLVPANPLEGSIEFRDVDFSYPSRQDVQILRGLSLTIPQGRMVAVVGPSGSGKSTLASLLMRFYDPEKGGVYVDGMNVRDLNPQWLRQHMGIVSQVRR